MKLNVDKKKARTRRDLTTINKHSIIWVICQVDNLNYCVLERKETMNMEITCTYCNEKLDSTGYCLNCCSIYEYLLEMTIKERDLYFPEWQSRTFSKREV